MLNSQKIKNYFLKKKLLRSKASAQKGNSNEIHKLSMKAKELTKHPIPHHQTPQLCELFNHENISNLG